MWRSIHHSQTIFNYLMELKLCQILSHIAIGHIMSILIAMFSHGYRGKTVDFALCSNHHRTTIGHFLNYGKWKDEVIQGNRQTRHSSRATADAVAQVKQRYTFALHSAGAWAGINFSAQVSSAFCANSGARSRTHCK